MKLIIVVILTFLTCSCSLTKIEANAEVENQLSKNLTLDRRMDASPLLFGEVVFEELFLIASKIREGDTIGKRYKLLNSGRTFYNPRTNSRTLVSKPREFLYKDYYKIPFDSLELTNLANNAREINFLNHYSKTYQKSIYERGSSFLTDLEKNETFIDGEGVISLNYFPIHDSLMNSWNYNVTYAHFSIKNFKLNGEAILFYPNGDTMAYGNFLDDKRHGLWVFKNYELISEGLSLFEYTIEFKYGEIEGFYNVKKDGILIYKFRIMDMRPVGNCEEYYESGQLKIKFNLNYCSHEIKSCENLLSFSEIYTKSFRGDKSKFIVEYFLNHSGSFYRFDKVQFNILDRVNGDIESYYENGNVMSKLFIESDLVFGKLYYEDGSLWKEWVYPSSSKIIYSKNGEIISNSTFNEICD